MKIPRRWVLASANRGKLVEIAAMLREAAAGPIELVTLAELDVESPAETGSTFVENALLKARHAARHTGLPAIADDSGIAVDALDGAPGVRSARFAGPLADDAANVARLLESLAAVPRERRAACFHCAVVALRSADDPAPVVATGRWAGVIAERPRGANGFGYDPVFFDPRLDKTAAELASAVKNRVSHRAQALRRLVEALAEGAGAGASRPL